MTDDLIASTLISWVSIGILLYLWRSLYPATRIEQFRQTIFDLREQLFDDAADGKLGFYEPPYLVLRTTMNGLLRDADALTLFEVAVLSATMRRHKDELALRNIFQDSLGSVDAERQRLYSLHRERMQVELMIFLMKRYLFLHVLLVVVSRIAKAKDWVQRSAAPLGRNAEIHAYSIGRIQSA